MTSLNIVICASILVIPRVINSASSFNGVGQIHLNPYMALRRKSGLERDIPTMFTVSRTLQVIIIELLSE